MGLNSVSAGKDLPHDFNVVIEIPAHADPVKYEVDKETGAIFVDRFMMAAMHYPCNYGYIPQTLGDDGDPLDVLVITPFPLVPGVVVRCRPLGMLKMEDEAGGDTKLVAVPISKLCPMYDGITDIYTLPEMKRQQIQHFFERYKDLEVGKWVKVTGWGGVEEACAEIVRAVEAVAGAQ